jgi:N-acyl-D-aspartate/D-glutamate deacylase
MNLAALLAGNVQRRFLPHGYEVGGNRGRSGDAGSIQSRLLPCRRKGRLAPGYDADFCLLDPHAPHVLSNDDLLYRHRQGPYDGRPCHVRVVRTVRRGETVFRDGKIVPGVSMGQLLARST